MRGTEGTFGFAGVTGVDTVYASRTRWEAGDGPHALAIAGQVLLFLLVTLLGIAPAISTEHGCPSVGIGLASTKVVAIGECTPWLPSAAE
jgi:hypothetical protein